MKSAILSLLLLLAALPACQSQINSDQPATPEVEQTYWAKYFEDSQSVHVNATFSQAAPDDGSGNPPAVERNVRLTGHNQVMLNGRFMEEQKGDLGYSYVFDAMGIPYQTFNHTFALIFTSSDGTQYPYTLVIPPRITTSVPATFTRDAGFEVDWSVDEKLQPGETIVRDIVMDDISCGLQAAPPTATPTATDDAKDSDVAGKVMVKLDGGSSCDNAKVAHVQICRQGPSQTLTVPSKAVIWGTYCAPRIPVKIKD